MQPEHIPYSAAHSDVLTLPTQDMSKVASGSRNTVTTATTNTGVTAVAAA